MVNRYATMPLVIVQVCPRATARAFKQPTVDERDVRPADLAEPSERGINGGAYVFAFIVSTLRIASASPSPVATALW